MTTGLVRQPLARDERFQLDYAVAGQRRTARHADETTACAAFDEVEAAAGTDWIALTEDADNAKGYRVVTSRGGPGAPDRFRKQDVEVTEPDEVDVQDVIDDRKWEAFHEAGGHR